MCFLWHQRVAHLRNAGNCSAFSIRHTTQTTIRKRILLCFRKNNSEKQRVRFGSTHKNTKIFSINLRSHFIYGTKEDNHRTKQNIVYQFTYVANKKDISIQALLIKVVFLIFVSSEAETDSMLSLHYCNNPDVISFLKRRKTRPRGYWQKKTHTLH